MWGPVLGKLRIAGGFQLSSFRRLIFPTAFDDYDLESAFLTWQLVATHSTVVRLTMLIMFLQIPLLLPGAGVPQPLTFWLMPALRITGMLCACGCSSSRPRSRHPRLAGVLVAGAMTICIASLIVENIEVLMWWYGGGAGSWTGEGLSAFRDPMIPDLDEAKRLFGPASCIQLLVHDPISNRTVAPHQSVMQQHPSQVRCFAHLGFAWNFIIAQLVLTILGAFTFLPTKIFVCMWSVSQAVIFGTLMAHSSATLILRPQNCVLVSVGLFAMALFHCHQTEAYCRLSFIFQHRDVHEHVGLERLKQFETSSTDRIVSMHVIALQRERQLMRIAMMSVDSIVKVDLSGGHAEILLPASEIRCRQLQSLLGTTVVPNTVEDALADSEHERWAAYKARCSIAAAAPIGNAEIVEPIRVRLCGCTSEVDLLLAPGETHGSESFLGLRAPPEATMEFTQQLDCVATGAALPAANISGSSVLEQQLSCHNAGPPLCAVPGEQSGNSNVCPMPRAKHDTASIPSQDGSNKQLVLSHEDMDCLPPDALVCVLGCDEPQRLEDVRPGQRLLTLDMTQSPPTQYTVVKSNSRTAASTDTWVRVTLADGSSICMTSNHPVWPECAKQMQPRIGAVMASDLMPGVDALWVVGPRLTTVVSTERVPTAEAPGDRMCLELERAEGAAEPQVLVARHEEETDEDEHPRARGAGCFVAVGDAPTKTACSRLDAVLNSSGMTLAPNSCGLDLTELQSFEEVTKKSLKRSYSDPGLETRLAESANEVEAVSSNDAMSNAMGGMSVHRSKSSQSSDDDRPWSSSYSQTGSWVSSHESTMSMKSSGLTQVLVGGPHMVRRCNNVEGGAVLLSDVLALPRGPDGTHLSFGSLAHELHSDQCRPCTFTSTKNRPCKFGALCHFCHATHRPYVKAYRKGANGKKYMRRAAHFERGLTDQVGRDELDQELTEVVVDKYEADPGSPEVVTAMQLNTNTLTPTSSHVCL
eukprot:gnl/TRDRNA2_/TRDRNA2_183732_c0_seq1.p1 gnl/TRDRNA2_/TRDRNA2_183732_c0~~gnl/TRDRNA2_/TRDRNA2_183732_c0_seq1.p1  ORF type:complete len:982 (+),score=102.84 gnl/TRDRNA2_/TRDRNA2_183732_c0_seq1:154-3099(+)